MFVKLREKISTFKVDNIYYFPRRLFFVALPVGLPLAGFIIFDILSNDFDISSRTFILAVIYFTILYLLFRTNQTVDLAISDLLYKNLDLKKTEAYFDFLLKKNKKFRNNSLSNLGIVAFYRGDFDAAIALFEKIDDSKWIGYQKFPNKLSTYFYGALSSIHIESEESLTNNLDLLQALKATKDKQEETKLKVASRIKAIQMVVLNKETVENFNLQQQQTHLMSIMMSYYQALNELNKENPAKAKVLFQEVATENPELFYVQEATHYLEEHAND